MESKKEKDNVKGEELGLPTCAQGPSQEEEKEKDDDDDFSVLGDFEQERTPKRQRRRLFGGTYEADKDDDDEDEEDTSDDDDTDAGLAKMNKLYRILKKRTVSEYEGDLAWILVSREVNLFTFEPTKELLIVTDRVVKLLCLMIPVALFGELGLLSEILAKLTPLYVHLLTYKKPK